MKTWNSNHRSQKALGLIEVALGLSLAMIGIIAVLHLDGLKNQYLKANRESGELRDLRAYLQRKISCPDTISNPACTSTARSQVEAKSCNQQNITNSANPTKIGNFEVKVSCGTDYGSERIFVEYRPFQLNPSQVWKDLNRGIPWTCSAGSGGNYNWSDLQISREFICGISNEEVYCWGENFMGALGDPSKNILYPSPIGRNGQPASSTRNDCPVKVDGLQKPVSKLMLSETSACALDATLAWKCWGGVELNSGMPITPSANSTPQEVLKLGNFISKTPKTLTIAVSLDKIEFSSTSYKGLCLPDVFGVKCFYPFGEYPNTYLDDVTISGIPAGSVQSVSGSGDDGCALFLGGVACWKKELNPNPNPPNTGQYEDAWIWPLQSIQPIGPNQGKNIVSVQGNRSSGCANTNNHEVWCWGQNQFAQLGIGNYSSPNTAVKVTNLSSSEIKKFYSTSSRRCILQDGGIKCWGQHPVMYNFQNTNMSSPSVISGFDMGQENLFCSKSPDLKCCTLNSNQELYCFGHNRGQSVDPTQSNTSTFVNKKLLENCQGEVWKNNTSPSSGGSSCTQ